MSSYIYDGALSPQTMEIIRSMMDSYSYPIELRALPPADILNKLPTHPSTGEDCMGREYAKESRMWGCVPRDFYNRGTECFMFLVNADEKQFIIESCPDLIVNPEPFKSVL